MEQNGGLPASWSPVRLHTRATAAPASVVLRTPRTTVTKYPDVLDSPGNPLAPVKIRKQHRNGYEQTPKTPSFQPFALNNPGAPRQRAFDISNTTRLEPIPALDPWEWNKIARAGALPLWQVPELDFAFTCSRGGCFTGDNTIHKLGT
ncbi:hypothetical protein C8J57DRAFT_1249503 [Mycena rebaudengoi]|nr:hypothetical protein C8J57DRAFT_1249503 [Mycena rebaudengoi]